MKEARQEELSWAARPIAEMVRLAWPIAVSMVSYSTMTLVDTFFLGWVGPSALAGVGLGGVMAWSLLCFPWGLLQGAKILASQAVGAGEKHRVGPYLASAILWALAIGLIMVGLGELIESTIPQLASSAEAGQAARSYFRIRNLGIPLVLLFCAFREIRQGIGDARSPMIASVSANILNMALDYFLIIHLRWGASGAAMASVIASVLELGVVVAVQAKGGISFKGLRPRDLLALWRMGWPTGGQMLIEMGCFAVLSIMVSRYSELHMAAHQIALQVIHFSFLPALALAEASAIMAGQAVGARRNELVRRVARMAMVVGGIYTGICSLLFGLGGTTIALAFTDQADLVDMTVKLLIVAALFQIFDAANMIARCTLRGTGDVRYPAIVGTIITWALTPPAMWFLGYHMGLGALGGWLGLCAEIMLGAILFWYRLERQGWEGAARRSLAVAG